MILSENSLVEALLGLSKWQSFATFLNLFERNSYLLVHLAHLFLIPLKNFLMEIENPDNSSD